MKLANSATRHPSKADLHIPLMLASMMVIPRYSGDENGIGELKETDCANGSSAYSAIDRASA